MIKQIYTTAFLISVFLSLSEYSYGWENKKTHPALTEKAIEGAVLNDYLSTQLGLTDGIMAELTWVFPADIKE